MKNNAEMFISMAKDYWATYRAYKRVGAGYPPGELRDATFIQAGENKARAQANLWKARREVGAV